MVAVATFSAPEWTSAPAFEVEVEAAGSGLGLTLVLAVGLPRAIGVLHRSVHAHERDLPDWHAEVDRDRQVRHVRELERQISREAAIHEPGGGVDQQAEATQ